MTANVDGDFHRRGFSGPPVFPFHFTPPMAAHRGEVHGRAL
jgi:hypothetical protein